MPLNVNSKEFDEIAFIARTNALFVVGNNAIIVFPLNICEEPGGVQAQFPVYGLIPPLIIVFAIVFCPISIIFPGLKENGAGVKVNEAAFAKLTLAIKISVNRNTNRADICIDFFIKSLYRIR